jgi:hypothetical protein
MKFTLYLAEDVHHLVNRELVPDNIEIVVVEKGKSLLDMVR